jgi:3-hydroxy-9,10-secoandrosta-1,3,5(10)-triene-9,17-dione monooxygenase
MTGTEFIGRARELLPSVRARARQAEQLRRLPLETFREFQDAGLFRALQPAHFGGLELDPGSFYEAVIEIGTACASSAWVLGVLGVHQWHVTLFPPRAQEEVWGQDKSAVVSSAYPPTGKAERVKGGFRLGGRWSFSSGCDYAGWVFLGGVVPSQSEDGSPPEVLAFLVPRRDYRIDDVWHVAGLVGTGSNDIVIDEAFVPDYRASSFPDAFNQCLPGQARNPTPLFRLPLGPVFMYGIASPAIGAALGTLQTYQEYTRSRRARLDGAKIAEDPDAQVRFAEAATAIDTVRLQLHRNCNEIMEYARAGTPVPLERRAQYRLDTARAIDAAWQAGNTVMAASGGTAIFLDHPLQRAVRDLLAMRLHPAANLGRASRNYGRLAFGLESEDSIL